jgi:hypothetical protein
MLDKERRENFLVGKEDSYKHKQNMCSSKAQSYQESFQHDTMREGRMCQNRRSQAGMKREPLVFLSVVEEFGAE